jgi:transketolase
MENVMQDSETIDRKCINTIRTLSMDAVQAANSGHPGAPMAMAPVGRKTTRGAIQ